MAQTKHPEEATRSRRTITPSAAFLIVVALFANRAMGVSGPDGLKLSPLTIVYVDLRVELGLDETRNPEFWRDKAVDEIIKRIDCRRSRSNVDPFPWEFRKRPVNGPPKGSEVLEISLMSGERLKDQKLREKYENSTVFALHSMRFGGNDDRAPRVVPVDPKGFDPLGLKGVKAPNDQAASDNATIAANAFSNACLRPESKAKDVECFSSVLHKLLEGNVPVGPARILVPEADPWRPLKVKDSPIPLPLPLPPPLGVLLADHSKTPALGLSRFLIRFRRDASLEPDRLAYFTSRGMNCSYPPGKGFLLQHVTVWNNAKLQLEEVRSETSVHRLLMEGYNKTSESFLVYLDAVADKQIQAGIKTTKETDYMMSYDQDGAGCER